MEKKCTTCEETKPLSEFTKDKRNKSGYGGQCKPCKNKRQAKKPITEKQREKNRIKSRRHYQNNKETLREVMRERNTKYRENNRQKYNDKMRDRYHKNKEVINAKRRERYENDPSLREKCSQQARTHYEKNREKYVKKAVDYKRNRRQTDIAYRLQCNVSNAVWYAVTGQRGSKGGKTFDELPYSAEQLKEHLETQFDEQMTWENYGSYWHIDHIYPQSRLPFDSLKHPNFRKCWALSNLRPLEAKENQSKGAKILTEDKT